MKSEVATPKAPYNADKFFETQKKVMKNPESLSLVQENSKWDIVNLLSDTTQKENIENEKKSSIALITEELIKILKEWTYHSPFIITQLINLINKNQDINEKDEYSHAALLTTLSSHSVFIDALKYALEDADLDVNNNHGASIKIAVANNNIEAFRLLLKREDLDVNLLLKSEFQSIDEVLDAFKVGEEVDNPWIIDKILGERRWEKKQEKRKAKKEQEIRDIREEMKELIKQHPSYNKY